jgi:hypothetical protein
MKELRPVPVLVDRSSQPKFDCFNGNQPIDFGIVRFIDDAHRSATQLGNDLVAPECGFFGRWHREQSLIGPDALMLPVKSTTSQEVTDNFGNRASALVVTKNRSVSKQKPGAPSFLEGWDSRIMLLPELW